MADCLFRDRRDAGPFLTGFLSAKCRAGGLRGSRRSLGERLDVFLVRKLGVPGREEPAMGAIASGGWRWSTIAGPRPAIAPETIQPAAEQEGRELLRR
jgi:predicted phosphoribosyltransferase